MGMNSSIDLLVVLKDSLVLSKEQGNMDDFTGDHDFFKDERFFMISYTRVNGNVNFKCHLKDYTETITKFLDWLSPFIKRVISGTYCDDCGFNGNIGMDENNNLEIFYF